MEPVGQWGIRSVEVAVKAQVTLNLAVMTPLTQRAPVSADLLQ
jgi:hypothetical protein